MMIRDRYLELIDRVANLTLEGKIRSKTQVYKLLVEEIEPGTQEIFDRCLLEKVTATEAQLETKVKAARVLRALQTLQGEWERYQQENRGQDAIASAAQQILSAAPDERLRVLLSILDPNQKQAFDGLLLQQLARSLQQTATIAPEPALAEDLRQLATGISQGIESFNALEEYLISWIYEQGKSNLGFGEVEAARGPWAVWAKHSPHDLPRQLFATLARNQPAVSALPNAREIDRAAWLDLTLLLQYLQRGLVIWFDKQPYDAKIGKQLSFSTLLTFAALWSQLASGLQSQPTLAEASFHMTLQTLRAIANRDDFPLYGGVFASFGGKALNDALNYFDEPLGRLEATPEKARILTLFGYSQQALGQYDAATNFHEQALDIARSSNDKACEVANLNHLSRICVAIKNYAEAIRLGQRALILARTEGDRPGEANALVNLGYGEVLSARQRDRLEAEAYEMAMNYLEQGLNLAQKLGDRQTQALAYNSLGIACVVLERAEEALQFLAPGLEAAQISGDRYLYALNYAYIAEAYRQTGATPKAIASAALGMYLLEQMGANEWRQPAGLLLVLQGEVGKESVKTALQDYRTAIIGAIGVDGYDYLPVLLERYRQDH
ncbi:tetratricopeptide repeat protein [Oscillatoria sp. FACHB-1406]|uniref:tetratricopeptide repeat protein n=1 Tax=Oscillatoria sp. FACHB-1406 TaxID=2692846 RepID=UPI00168A0740|nr:tetratricopeptide repeat protein [Oscillatoria sp. FACHB-1406]MBD2576722.1 tetratricopeptide repeat protein [Oscillatoria sp. FACHB-1406]